MGIGGAYERELRSVLAGEEKGVHAITRSCNESERAQAMQICQRPFLVVRAPGSCLLYTSPSPRDQRGSRMPSYA